MHIQNPENSDNSNFLYYISNFSDSPIILIFSDISDFSDNSGFFFNNSDSSNFIVNMDLCTHRVRRIHLINTYCIVGIIGAVIGVVGKIGIIGKIGIFGVLGKLGIIGIVRVIGKSELLE